MHRYVSNKSYFIKVLIALTVLTLLVNCLLVPLFSKLVEELQKILEPSMYPFLVCLSVGFSSFFAIFYALFDNFVWKILPVFNKQKINGVYHCEGKSYHEDGTSHDWDGIITIKQTWSKILVTLKTESSFSQSYMANIDVLDSGIIKLYYFYRNEPKDDKHDLKKHEGTAIITFNDASVCGSYYNNPSERHKYGSLNLNKLEKKR